MSDRAVQIADEVSANRGRHCRSNAGDDHRSRRDLHGRVASPFNIDSGESWTELLKARGEKPAGPWRANSDQAVHRGTALIEGPQDGPAFSGRGPLCPIVKKSHNGDGRRAHLRSEGDFTSKSARPDNDHRVQLHNKSLVAA